MNRNIQVRGIHAEVPESPLFSFVRYPEFVSTDVHCPTSIEPIERDSVLFAAVALAEWTRKWRELEKEKYEPGTTDFGQISYDMDHARSQAYHWLDIYKIAADAEAEQIQRGAIIDAEAAAKRRIERGEKP